MAEEEETIGDVLSRTSKLLKDEMTTEVESYGLEVDPAWTKDEIMEHFEVFLTETAEEAPEEAPEVIEGSPSPEPPPPAEEVQDAALSIPPPPTPPGVNPTTSTPIGTSDVRITPSPSRGWGRSAGAKAP